MNWKLGKLIKNKTYKLWGVNIFDYQWTDTGETVHLKDYTDGIRKDFTIYIRYDKLCIWYKPNVNSFGLFLFHRILYLYIIWYFIIFIRHFIIFFKTFVYTLYCIFFNSNTIYMIRYGVINNFTPSSNYLSTIMCIS